METSPEVKTPTPAAPTPAAAKPIPSTKPQTEVRKPKQDRPPEDDRGVWKMNRRSFFSMAGWISFAIFLFTATIGALRFMFPRVLYEPPSAFKAGYPENYILGEVSEKYKDQYRVWIIRDLNGFIALSGICTHLGCTPRYLASDNKFKCPCHGSGFRGAPDYGIHFEGPAPRPLERLQITLADDGQILVDRNIKFRFENGDWTKPDSFLKWG